jgi:hypothetical protein
MQALKLWHVYCGNAKLQVKNLLEEFYVVISQKQASVQTATGLKIYKPGEETRLSCCTDPRRKRTCYKLKNVRCKDGEAY